MRIHTSVLSAGSFVIDASMNAIQLSVQGADSTASFTIEGDLTIGSTPSAAISIGNGNGISISAPTGMSPLQGITITQVAGNINIVITQTS